ncbi:MAG: PhoH family protein [Deltaproteobacteria bacterium]|nr:MAG: PhoH family protein [Deltaproteobacteria bacterium]
MPTGLSPEHCLTVNDAHQLRELVGEFGAHLKLIERAFEVRVRQRGGAIVVDPAPQAAQALGALRQLLYLVRKGHALHPSDVEQALRIVGRDPAADLGAFFSDTVVVTTSGRSITPRTVGQQKYIDLLRRFDVVFGIGPAGTGKTYLAVATAAAALLKGEVKRIVLTRPAVEAGEKLGFLPGDLNEKVDPYLRPLYDALYDVLGPERTARLLERQTIEVAPLAFMRGRTLSESFVILDEAQNTTVEQMKMFLTRLGERSRMVITGDDTQVDLPRGSTSGLVDAVRVLDGVSRIGVARFTSADVVRHPLVADIIGAYEVDLARQRGEQAAAVRSGQRGSGGGR